jgi:hypothetical protein
LTERKRNFKNLTGYQIDFSNKGGLVMPLILEFTFEDGSKLNDKISAQIWRKNEKKFLKLIFRQKIKVYSIRPNERNC